MASRLRRLLRWLLEKRYHVLSHLFGAPVAGEAQAQPGSVFIQVDALGYDNLLAVLKRGGMPHLNALLDSGEYQLERWRCGLPSDTPPVQSGLMYGYNEDLVGFYWMDKSTGRRQNCANPPHAKLLEEHVAARGEPGLLSGGSSYGTIVSGNARKTVFTVSCLDSYHLHNAYGLLGALLFAVFKPQVLVSTPARFMWDVIREMLDFLDARRTGRLRRREGFFPITRAIINIIFRDVATAGAIMDMFCGLRTIYVSYLGYDVVSHHNGPLSHNALRTLKGIDRAIGRLRRASGWCRRPYRIYILSDHGMNPAIIFHQEYGQPLSSYISSVVGDQVAVDEYDADRYLGREQLSPLNQDLEEMEKHLPRSVAGLVHRIRTFVYHTDGYRSPVGGGRISVIDCSPIAHIYVHGTPYRLEVAEIGRVHPGLVEALVSHPGVGLLMGLENGRVVLYSKDGRAVLGDRIEVEGNNPLLQFEEPDLAAQEIKRFGLTPLSGDLILFGAVHGGLTVCFQNQLGAHGSVGGDQSSPFFIHPAGIDVSLDGVTTAAEMYPILCRLVGMEARQAEVLEPSVPLIR